MKPPRLTKAQVIAMRLGDEAAARSSAHALPWLAAAATAAQQTAGARRHWWWRFATAARAADQALGQAPRRYYPPRNLR